MDNAKFLWASKHWGVGIGAAMAIAGLVLAIPGNMNDWRRAERTSLVFGQTFIDTVHIRQNEAIPSGYKVMAIEYGSHETKILGTGLLLLGSTLVWSCAQALSPEYERIETTNWRIRQSEFQLEDVQIQQNTEVARWAIELDAQSDISRMINPPKPYMEEEEDEEGEQKAIAPNKQPKFTESCEGYLGWLIHKGIRQAKLREVAALSFNGKKIPTDQIRRWIDELCTIEAAEWLTEDKTEFRLLNG